jgi:hypothetical protein
MAVDSLVGRLYVPAALEKSDCIVPFPVFEEDFIFQQELIDRLIHRRTSTAALIPAGKEPGSSF